jgi:hypothetical protein
VESGESRCRVKKETDMATSAKQTVQLLLKAPLIFHPLIIHPSSLFHPKPIDKKKLYIYSALNENSPTPLTQKILANLFFLITKWKLQNTS